MADEIIAHGITREVHRPNAILRVMAKHPELCFILFTVVATLLSNYGSSFKSKPEVVPARMPEPLFPSVSSVMDLYLGDLHPLVEMVKSEDLIFVMYYAPWCAKSHIAVSQFLKASTYLDGQVKFVAVNCWYPEGLCRKQYKFLLYPVFFAYHRNNDGYRYMGIERADYMVKFLEDLLTPLTLLNSADHVKDFLTEHDTVVVGYFNFNSSPQPPGFQQFYYASMRAVEHDPYQPIKFGIVKDHDLALYCHMTQLSEIVFLRINNATLKYPLPNNITSTNLVAWAFATRHQLPVRWVVPLGMKSLTLSKEINKGPAVILFHRVSPLSSASQTLALFKHLALSYYQCPGDAMAADFSHRWLALSVRNILKHARILNMCRDFHHGRLIYTRTFKCCITVVSNCSRHHLHPNKIKVCEICQYRSDSQRKSVCSFDRSYKKICSSAAHKTSAPSNTCLNSITTYDKSSYTSSCCKLCNRTNISYVEFLKAPFSPSSAFTSSPFSSTNSKESEGARRPTDRYVIESLENLPRRLCSRLTFQKAQGSYPSTIIPDFATTALPEGFTGQGCKVNRTVRFITLDSQNHWMIAKSLGLDVSQAHVSPVVVAFDKEKEEQILLREKFSKKTTASFILNFTRGLLPRHLRSVSSDRKENCSSQSSLCVMELTTATFQAAISQPKDMVILVYAGWCGFCAALSHTFLHLAHYFHTSSNISFARINGDSNDLPWEFSMDSYPTIIFFPAHREADSMAFPDNVTPSLPNLIRFVLQHATYTTRLHLVADVCSTTCIQENLDLAKHTLHVLRSKLHRVRFRLTALRSVQDRSKLSHYDVARENILKSRVDELQTEIKEVRTLKEFLQNSKGKRLDRKTVEEVLHEKMHWKDLSEKT